MSAHNREKVDILCRGLREELEQSVLNLDYDGATLSGGLDTSIVNYIASGLKGDLQSVKVGFEESSRKDFEYAGSVEIS